MNYIQTLFSIFNAPLFATFIIAMFWKRATAWGGFFSLVAGTAAAYATNRLNAYHAIFHFGSALSASFWQAIIAFLVGGLVLVVVSLVTKPKPDEDLAGARLGPHPQGGARGQRRPARQAVVALADAARRRRDRPADRASTSSSSRRSDDIGDRPWSPGTPPAARPHRDEEEAEAVRKANRFDIRRLIGGLFVLYGLILLVLGLCRLTHGQAQGGRDQHRPVDRDRDARVRRADDLLGARRARSCPSRAETRGPGLRADPPGAGHLTRVGRGLGPTDDGPPGPAPIPASRPR